MVLPRRFVMGLLTACITACLCTVSAAAFDWPVRHRVLTATFGENRWDHFHDGIDIGGGEQPVHPAASGEVIFTYDEGQDPRDLPSGLGSFIVIQHSPAFRTLYAHLRAGSVLQDKPHVTASDVIGLTGDTGDSVGVHLHFEIIDLQKREILNPLTLLPPLPDSLPPVIASVSLMRGNKLIRLGPSTVVPEGEATVVADVYDPSQYVSYFDPMAPYEITATLNGHELFNITYDALKEQGGRSYLLESHGRTFSSYYLSAWDVRLGSMALKAGRGRLVVVARDFAGNQTSRSFDLTVTGGGG